MQSTNFSSNLVQIGWKTKILSFRVSFDNFFGNSPSVLVGRVNIYMVFKFGEDRMKNKILSFRVSFDPYPRIFIWSLAGCEISYVLLKFGGSRFEKKM
jgi:hypothetical protein